MIIDIFIRTYIKDFKILTYCLYGIEKYLKGYRDIILTVKENEYNLLAEHIDITKYKVYKVPNYNLIYSKYNNPDYCGQQIDKLNADLYSNADYIFYVDCDVMIYNDFNLHELCFDENNKLIVFKSLWENVGDAKCWKKCLIELDLVSDYEYMRRLPQLYPTKYLKEIRLYIESKIDKEFSLACFSLYQKTGFSEFNIIGSFIDKFYPNELNLCLPESYLHTKYNYNANCAKQLWSHTKQDELITNIKQILHI
jgi:hypothetical protein